MREYRLGLILVSVLRFNSLSLRNIFRISATVLVSVLRFNSLSLRNIFRISASVRLGMKVKIRGFSG